MITEIYFNRYMYSLVFAADMYATVFKKDPLDPALGDKYRRSILHPGGSREEIDSLTVCVIQRQRVGQSVEMTFIGIFGTPSKL